MNPHRSILALAALSLPLTAHAVPVAMPAPASVLAPSDAMHWDPEREVAHRHDDYYYDRYHRRNRVRTSDVIAGVVVIGTIAALLASRNNNRDRDREVRDRDDRDRDARYRTERRDYRAGRGIDGAVQRCVDEVEREGQVETIDTAQRDGSGWLVTGRMANGERYSCRLGSDGRIEDIAVSSRDYSSRGGSRDDDYYARARRDVETGAPEARQADEDSPLRDWTFDEDESETTFAGIE